jgi:hypothetical protein
MFRKLRCPRLRSGQPWNTPNPSRHSAARLQQTGQIQSLAAPMAATVHPPLTLLGLVPVNWFCRTLEARHSQWLILAALRSFCGANVPDHGRSTCWVQRAFVVIRLTRRIISSAARRVNVNSRIRCGSTPVTTRCATRWARVFVFPEPAPAITRSGEGFVADAQSMPCSTARRCSLFRSVK